MKINVKIVLNASLRENVSFPMNNAIIDLFYQAEDYFFRSISKECLDFDEFATAYFTGINFECDNPVYIRNNIASSNEVLNRCEQFYEKHNSPWNVIVTEQFITNELIQSLNNMGFSLSGKSVAMFVELNKQSKHNIKDDVVIHLVSDKLDQWMLPVGSAFETTAEVTRHYADIHKRALNNKANFHHFTLYKGELPISSLTISLQSNVARIHDVGTLPEYQNKGYATQLMKYAINKASDLGAQYCVLEASESGLTVYEKLGFMPLFKNNTYSQVRTNLIKN